MASNNHTGNQSWNADAVLNLTNRATKGWTCVGHTPSAGRRCRNPLAAHHKSIGEALLRTIPEIQNRTQLLNTLKQIARYLLCVRDHQDQVDQVASRWQGLIAAHRQAPSFSQSNNAANAQPIQSIENRHREELRACNEALAQARCLLIEQQAERRRAEEQARQLAEALEAETRARERAERDAEAERVRLDDEAHEYAQQEQALLDAAVRELEERERAEWERIELESAEDEEEDEAPEPDDEAEVIDPTAADQVETGGEEEGNEAEDGHAESAEEAEEGVSTLELRERQSRRRRELAEREEHEWNEAWRLYEQDWAYMARMDMSSLDEDLKDSIPWPVRSGQWRDVTSANVRAFLRQAPDGRFRNIRRRRTLLRRQAMLWMRQSCALTEDEEAHHLILVVIRVTNELTEDL